MVYRSLKGAAVVAAALLFVGAAHAADVVEGPEVTWNHAVWGKPRAFTYGLEHLAKQLAERTGGKFEYKISYGGLSNEKETLDGIQIGAFEAANFCNFYHPDKNPTAMVFSLPFLPIGDWDVRIKASDAYYKHPAVIEDMKRWNAHVYMAGILPQYEFMGRGKPPKTLEEWKGLRVRAGGGIGTAMEMLGATLTTVPATEVYTIMERGTVDAVSFPYTYAHAAYKVHEVADWFTSNFQPGTADCPTVFNIDAYNALPQSYKDLLEELKWEVYEVQRDAYLEADKKNLPIFREKLQEVTFTEAELEEFRQKVGKPVWDQWVKENEGKIPAQELLDFLLDEAKKAGAS